MPTRSLNVLITGDASKLTPALHKATKETEEFGKKSREASEHVAEGFKKVHEAGKLLAEIGGITALTFGLKDVTEEAVKSEAEQKKLANTVKDAGLSWKAHGKEVDEWLDKTSRASGFVKSDLESALGNFIRTTGSVTKAQKLEGEAMDIARSKGVGLANAQSILARVYNGSYVGLKRLGIAVTPVTTAQDALKASTGKATDAQKAHAKALDASATRTEALSLVQTKFGGQAKAYASSTAGAFDRAKASLNLFEERVGKVVLPLMAKAANAIAVVGQSAEEHWPQVQAIAQRVFGTLKPTIDRVTAAAAGLVRGIVTLAKGFQQGQGRAVAIVSVLGGLAAGIVTATVVMKTVAAVTKAWTIAQAALNVVLDANPIGLVIVAIAGLAAGLVIAYKKSETFRNIVNGTWNAIKSVAETVFPIIEKMMKFGLLGPIGLAITHFGTIKRVATDAWDAIKTGADAVVKAVQAVGSVFKGVASVVGKVGGALNPFGDGRGPGGDGMGMLFQSLGGFSGGLDGANAFMGPFASLGSGMGLHLTAGRNHHSTMTASGNVSYHSLGDAIDEAGPFPAMHRYAQTLYSRFGGRLRELISPWPELGIKDGQPFRYDAATQAQHSGSNAHVHVAYAPSGDGPGVSAKRSRADEMGWLTGQWQKVAPVFGLDPSKRPLPSLFKHIRLSPKNIFVGVTSNPGDTTHKGDELLWPAWLWRATGKGKDFQAPLPDKVKLKLFVHEMAHRFQDAKATNSAWKAEGGAEAFARFAMNRFFGGMPPGMNAGDPYNGFTQRVVHDLGTPWVLNTQFGRGAGTGDGLGRLSNGPKPPMSRDAVAALAESVGLPGITFADIARGESGYDPDNVGHDPGGTTGLGLWQITTGYNDDIIAKYGGQRAMFDPRKNALAARDIWHRQGRGAWVGSQFVTGWDLHYKGPLSGSSKGRAGSTVSTGPRTVTYTATVPGGAGAGAANSGTLTAGPGAGSGYSKGPAMFGPAAAGRTDAGRLEQIGLGLAENQGKKTKTAQLLFEEAVIKRRRLDAVKKALKGRLTKKARTALTEEATTLIGELRDISTAMYELTGGKAGLSASGNAAGSPADLAERAANAPADDSPTAGDFVDAAIAEAALTPDTADDIAAASGAVGYWESQLAAARASGDPRKVTAAATGLKSAQDGLKSLTDAITANTDALNGVRADLEAQRADQAEASLKVSQSQYGVLAQAMWDAVNQFGGARIGLGLSGLTAPAGAVSRA